MKYHLTRSYPRADENVHVESEREDDPIGGHPTKKNLDQGTELKCQEFCHRLLCNKTFSYK